MINLDLNLPSSSLSKEELNQILSSITNNATNITNLTNKYNTGVSTITTKVTQCGVSTANNAAPSTIANNIGAIYANRYNQGISDGRVGYVTQSQYNNYGNQKYNEGVTAADNRANPNSTNYQTGYNNGVTDDRRGYYTQAQYNQYGNDRYNAGYSAGQSNAPFSLGKLYKYPINSYASGRNFSSVVDKFENRILYVYHGASGMKIMIRPSTLVNLSGNLDSIRTSEWTGFIGTSFVDFISTSEVQSKMGSSAEFRLVYF